MWSLWLGRWVCSEIELLFLDLIEVDGEWDGVIFMDKIEDNSLFRCSSRNIWQWLSLFFLLCLAFLFLTVCVLCVLDTSHFRTVLPVMKVHERTLAICSHIILTEPQQCWCYVPDMLTQPLTRCSCTVTDAQTDSQACTALFVCRALYSLHRHTAFCKYKAAEGIKTCMNVAHLELLVFRVAWISSS